MLGIQREIESPLFVAARLASPSNSKRETVAKHDGGDGEEFFVDLGSLQADYGFDWEKLHMSEEFFSIFEETAFDESVISLQHCKSLDDILAMGEPQILQPSLAQLDDNSTLEAPSALAEGISPNTPADEGKQAVLDVFDACIDAYQEEAFQAQLKILFQTENLLRKRQAKAPAVYARGAAHVKGRDELCKKVLSVVLPRHEFVGRDDGRPAFSLAARQYYNDSDVQKKMKTIDLLLGLPPQATFEDLRLMVKLQQPHLKLDKILGN